KCSNSTILDVWPITFAKMTRKEQHISGIFTAKSGFGPTKSSLRIPIFTPRWVRALSLSGMRIVCKSSSGRKKGRKRQPGRKYSVTPGMRRQNIETGVEDQAGNGGCPRRERNVGCRSQPLVSRVCGVLFPVVRIHYPFWIDGKRRDRL